MAWSPCSEWREPCSCGVLNVFVRCPVAVGALAHLLGFGIAQLVSTAWPIAILGSVSLGAGLAWPGYRLWHTPAASDRKSTRLNSSHTVISYAVFCLKKKKK